MNKVLLTVTAVISVIVATVAGGFYFARQPKGETMNTTNPTPTPDTNSVQGISTDEITTPSATFGQNATPSPTLTTYPKTFALAPSMQIDVNKTYTATLHTTAGDIVIALDAKATPVTVNNFVFLAGQHFYDNTIFHRVIKGFMVQGGDPKGDGTGGPGYRFNDEPVTGDYTRGTVAMANAGPNTNGSQFFIMHGDYALQKNYVIFGHVTTGLEVVDKIATAEVTTSASGEDSKPVNPVTVTSVEIAEK